ncbi:MAG: superoxide dismutase [Chlamydiia bacterium]|nr:superoxide dismutase [Chlamydiia bacterium]
MVKQYTLPNLPYNYNALEPVISAEIMEFHHKKHHNGYVTNLNKALLDYEKAEESGDLETMISLQSAIKFNGGGHINHSIFWTNLAPIGKGGGEFPKGEFADKLIAQYGSFDAFIQKFNSKAGPLQGSGWCWLGFCKSSERFHIVACNNQDPLKGSTPFIPLLGIDVWEHAYYLQYKNVRLDYLKAIWQIVNWANVADRFEKAKKVSCCSA